MVCEQPRVAGMNMMLADGHAAYALEITSDRAEVFEPEEGVLVRTNHYCRRRCPRLRPRLRRIAARLTGTRVPHRSARDATARSACTTWCV